MVPLNPNSLARTNSNPEAIFKVFHFSFKENKTLEDNFATVVKSVAEAKVLFKKEKLGKLIKYMVWALTPVFSNKKPERRDSKVGGIPDLGRYHIQGKTKNLNAIAKSWPKCGVCYQDMKFLAQVDLKDWLVPIHSLVANFEPRYSKETPESIYAYESSIGGFRSVEHTTWMDKVLWQFFSCPHAGMEFYNPNYNGRILISTKHDGKAATEPSLLEKLNFKHPRMPRESFVANDHGKKIERLEFKIDIDSVGEDYSLLDRADKVMESRPDLFKMTSDMTFFGTARSQQEPKRYWMPLATVPTRMTPIVSWNDSNRDMTYQMYVNTSLNDGFKMYGLVDGSCT